MRNLAAHHAAWWESDRLSQFPWLLRPFEPPLAGVLHALYQDSLERAFTLMGDRVRSDFREIGTAIGRHLPQVYARLGQSGTTLVHGDYQLENMLFGAPGSADEVRSLLGTLEVDVGDADVGAVLRQALRDTPPDSRTPTRDERDLALEIRHRSSSSGGAAQSLRTRLACASAASGTG